MELFFFLPKASRAQILKKAAEYIQFMRKKNNTVQSDIDEIAKQNKLLEDQSMFWFTAHDGRRRCCWNSRTKKWTLVVVCQLGCTDKYTEMIVRLRSDYGEIYTLLVLLVQLPKLYGGHSTQ